MARHLPAGHGEKPTAQPTAAIQKPALENVVANDVAMKMVCGGD